MGASSASVVISASAGFTESFGSFGSAVPISLQWTGSNTTFAAGSGAKQYNNCYAASLSVTAGTPLVVTLNGGTIKNPDGTTASLTDIVALLVANTTASGGGTLTMGGGTNEVTSIWGATGTENVLPGGVSVKVIPAASGFAITPSTAMTLQFVASTGTVNFDLMCLGH